MAELTSTIIDAVGGDPTARVGTGIVPAAFKTAADYYLSDGTVNPSPTDDADKIQAALNAAKFGETIVLSRYYFLNGKTVVLATPNVTVTGPGGFVNGTLAIGLMTGSTVDYNITISGVQFLGSATVAAGTATGVGISVRLARRVFIINKNTFRNLNKGVEVPSFAGEVFHGTSMMEVNGNHFYDVNYALYYDNNGLAANSRPAWQHVSDCSFNDNVVNRAYIGAVWIKGIDGFTMKGGIVFHVSYDDPSTTLKNLKDRTIYIGESDWTIISNVKIFEPGLEGIHLDAPKNFRITGNQIAWPGQKAPASAVKLTGGPTFMSAKIEGNTFSQFTKHGVEIQVNLDGVDATSFSRAMLANNRYEYLQATTKYYGSTPLSSLPHFAAFQETNSNCLVEETGGILSGVRTNSLKNSPRSGSQYNNHARSEGYEAQVSVTAANTPIALLANNEPTETASYSALIFIVARQGNTQAGNTASYYLNVTKGFSGDTGSITLLNSQGLKTGGAANHPSFTFTFDGVTNQLRATPVSNTSGSFYFNATVVGSARLYLP